MNLSHVIGDVPEFAQMTFLRTLADAMLPEEGWVTAQELGENEEEIKTATETLEMLQEVGLAMAVLTVVGNDKQWAYGRMHARRID